MKDYLIFRLYGPMASWGDIAVGEVRTSHTHPSKSAILGLIAAALKISRDQESLHRQLQECYGVAVLVDNAGVPLSDYHTIQVPPSGTGRKRRIYSTRRDEIVTLPREKLSTILSKRGYRTDALATAALWTRNSPPFSLDELSKALLYPSYTLYLGRKSCPLSLPLEPQIVTAETLIEALTKTNFLDLEELHNLTRTGRTVLYWEKGAETGMEPQQIFERHDVPISRKRWQFAVRKEYQAYYPEEG